MSYSQDLDLYLKLVEKQKIISILPEILVQHRKHSEAINIQKGKEQHKCYLNILHNFLERNYFKINDKAWVAHDRFKIRGNTSLTDLFLSINLDRRLFKYFLKREVVETDLKRKLKNAHRHQLMMYLKRFFKCNFPFVYKLINKSVHDIE